jgi:hypothetical protein
MTTETTVDATHDPRDRRSLRRFVTVWDGEVHARTLSGVEGDMQYAAFTGELPWDRVYAVSDNRLIEVTAVAASEHHAGVIYRLVDTTGTEHGAVRTTIDGRA